MELIDLLSRCNDYEYVEVYDTEDNLLDCYDGRNSIDDSYNECEVIEVCVCNHAHTKPCLLVIIDA